MIYDNTPFPRKGTWTIARWWLEPGIVPDTDMLDALRTALLQ